MNVTIDPDFAARVPGYRVIIAECHVVNAPTSNVQKAEMDALCTEIQATYEIADINRRPAIAATREAYKRCGKDPNRYRPSQEQLMRRVVRGLGLYNVDAIVDAGNQFSLLTGCSIGCFDRDKIDGEMLTISIGREGEPYEGIGRGSLNVAGLPIVRDSSGGIGTPTSDNERTKIDLSTTRLISTVHLFDPDIDAEEIVSLLRDLLSRHAKASGFSSTIYESL